MRDGTPNTGRGTDGHRCRRRLQRVCRGTPADNKAPAVVTRVDGRTSATTSASLSDSHYNDTIVGVSDEGRVAVQQDSDDRLTSCLESFDGVEPSVTLFSKVTAWSPEAGLVAEVTTVTDSGSCSRVSETGSANEKWRTCDHQIVGFSPDGKWAYAKRSDRNQFGPTDVAVLNASSGTVVRELSIKNDKSDYGIFTDEAWESADRMVLLVETSSTTALVRWDVGDGTVQLATPATSYAGVDDYGPDPYGLG